MNEEKKEKKKVRLSKLFWYAIIVGVLVYLIISFGMNLGRKINIKKDMESMYADADFVEVNCDRKPCDKEELEERYVWFGDGIPEEDLYAFRIKDSEDNSEKGYATKDGKVVFDTYCNTYYADETIAYFEEVVDFEHNFPGMSYYILQISYMNWNRYVLTQDCTTFEGYRKAGTVGYSYMGTGGYPTLLVGLEDTSKETRTAIKQLLTDADFDIYVRFSSINSEYTGDECLYMGETCGSYYPFDASYGEAILGE